MESYLNHSVIQIFERVSDGIIALDNNWYCVYVNQAAAQLLGRSAAALMGKHVWTEFPETIGQSFYYAYHKAAREQVFVCIEEYFAPWNRWFENRIYPDAQGLTIYFTEITERKLAEATQLRSLQLQQELKLLESVLDQVLAGYWDWHIPNHTHYMSYGWKRMLGYENDELPTTPETWKEMIFPEDLPLVMTHFEAHIQSHGAVPYYNEVRYFHKNGSIVWMICAGQVIEWDAHGHPVRMIGCHIDITDRKRAEQTLAENIVQVEDLYNNAPCGYHSLDSAGRLVRVNETELEWLGYERSEMIGHSITDFLTENSRQAFQHNFAIFKEQGWVKNLEYEMICKNGSILPILVSARVVKDDNGNILYNRATLLDIRDRKEAEAKLQKANQNLQRSNHDLEQFAHIISHDLQEPLRTMTGFSEILGDHLQQNAPDQFADDLVQEALSAIADGGGRMRQMIRDLLTYSRLDHEPLNYDLIDSNRVLAEVLQDLKGMIEASQAVITSDPLPELAIDQAQFRQILSNLIINAIKFRRDIAPKIHIAVIEQKQQYQFTVQDNGIGIAPQYLPQVFHAFRRLHPHHKFPGTGLGLAICQKIVVRYGGSIWANSTLGQGSTFTFTLPMKHQPDKHSLPEFPACDAVAPVRPSQSDAPAHA